MALQIQRRRNSRPDTDAPRRIRLVKAEPDPAQNHEVPEEFFYPVNTRAARVPSGRRFPRRLAVGLLVVCVAVAVTGVLRSGGASKPSAVRTAPSRASVAAKPPAGASTAVTGVPMSIVASSVDTDGAARTYRASVSIRNPTDVAATEVTVRVTFADASGSILKTEQRTVDVLGSGRIALLDFAGELAPGAPAPAALDVTATAARLELPPPPGA